jgi:hypothetical protein
VESVLAAEPAILVHLKPVRVVLFVLNRVVVPLLAIAASQCDFNSHLSAPSVIIIVAFLSRVNSFTRKKDLATEVGIL